MNRLTCLSLCCQEIFPLGMWQYHSYPLMPVVCDIQFVFEVIQVFILLESRTVWWWFKKLNVRCVSHCMLWWPVMSFHLCDTVLVRFLLSSSACLSVKSQSFMKTT